MGASGAAAEVLRLHRDRAAGHHEDHQQHERRCARTRSSSTWTTRSARRTRSSRTASSRTARRRRQLRARGPDQVALRPGSISIGTLAHEIAHQWFGDSVGPATWREIWFNEGWATWWATYWSNKQNGSPQTTAQSFRTTTTPTRTTSWDIAARQPAGPRRAVRHDPGLHAAGGMRRGLPPDRRRHRVLRLPEGAGDRVRATARSAATSSWRWPSGSPPRRPASRPPTSAKLDAVLPAVDLGAGQADAEPDDVLPEHERARRRRAARCRRRCR